ncbi:regulatory protein GemA [uncultured Sphingobium sp.]|uniref:regulatory protein GemA n=1 Tax=uncultured Sphingobium sp. TaxID=316087 RepID=UPI00259B5970|nr:regulatory protein GemA [uncultured Sphingobium sp.]
MADASRITARSPRQQGKGDYGRVRLMTAIRAACKRQGVDDDMRKAIQDSVIGKASMSDMTIAELGQMLDHFNKGWKGPMGHRAHIGKIKALWWSLYWLGAIDEPGDHAISAFVERQTGVSALKFLDHQKAFSVIEALKGWLERVGVQWADAETVARIAEIAPAYCDQLADRHAVLAAIDAALYKGGVLRTHYALYLQTAMGLAANHHFWTAAELDAGIRLLGRKLRRMKGKEARD